MAKPRKHRGVFEKVKESGMWWIRYTDQYGKIHREKVGSFKAAVGSYEQRKTEVRLGRFDPEDVVGKHRHVLFNELVKDRMEASEELASYPMEKNRLGWWLQKFRDMPADSIAFQDIQKSLVELRKNRTPATSNRYLASLKATFNLGLKNQKVERSPCVGIKSVAENNEIIRWLNTEEEKKLFAVLPLECQLAVTVAIHTGLRKREQMSLKWTDVNFFSNIITLRETKAGKVQHVPMNKCVVEAFRTLRSMPVDVSQEVFYRINISSPSGQYYKLDRVWEECWKKAGIGKLRWHDLRHTFASRLVMGGENILTVQKLCRHADVKVTMRYAHLAPEHLQRAVDSLVNWSELAPELAPSLEDSLP